MALCISLNVDTGGRVDTWTNIKFRALVVKNLVQKFVLMMTTDGGVARRQNGLHKFNYQSPFKNLHMVCAFNQPMVLILSNDDGLKKLGDYALPQSEFKNLAAKY